MSLHCGVKPVSCDWYGFTLDKRKVHTIRTLKDDFTRDISIDHRRETSRQTSSSSLDFVACLLDVSCLRDIVSCMLVLSSRRYHYTHTHTHTYTHIYIYIYIYIYLYLYIHIYIYTYIYIPIYIYMHSTLPSNSNHEILEERGTQTAGAEEFQRTLELRHEL